MLELFILINDIAELLDSNPAGTHSANLIHLQEKRRMRKNQTIKISIIFATVILFFNAIITAKDIKFKPRGKAFTLKDKNNADDQLIEPSAVETIDKDGKYLLVADDKTAELRVISASDGKLLREPLKLDSPKKPKWEAMTKDEEGFFYLIGSHAAKNDDDKEKLLDRSHLYRFRLIMNDDPSKIELDGSSLTEFDIKSSLKDLGIYTEQPSEKNVKIEGLALRASEGKKYLVFGFREPSALVEVYFADIPAEVKKGVIIKLLLKPYFHFDAKTTSDGTRFKLSSIEYVPDLKGFIVLTSTETTEKAANGKDKPVFHGNAVWFISDKKIKIPESAKFSQSVKQVKAKKVTEFEPTIKAEGFCLIPTIDKKNTQLVIVFDNDTEDMKKAEPNKFLVGMMQFVELLHKNP